MILISDSEAAAIFKFTGGKVKPFITENLLRPTGIAALDDQGAIYVVDTGDHSLKIFDYEGKFIKKIGGQAEGISGFNFPTFALATANNQVIINDALNYKIKRFDGDGNLEFSFGEEGNGPGTFSRPKGIAMDDKNHIYVVDNIFDNIQVFSEEGILLLVIGSGGQNPGQFWSPAGIDIVDNIIYIADTYNNRVQILRYIEGGKR
jgi:DNA-binding beta-propeller fold protein YncE